MFFDYKKAISKKPMMAIVDSPEIVNYFNKLAPAGTHYIAQQDGSLLLVGKDRLHIDGVELCLTEQQQEILGKNVLVDDIIEYMENAQESINFKLKKEGFININGSETPIEKINFKPFENVKYVEGSLKMVPSPLPSPFEMEISANGISRKLLIQRVPFKSSTIRKFKSINDDIFEIEYLIDAKNEKFDFTYRYHINKAESARQIYDLFNLILGFMQGSGYFGQIKINKTSATDLDLQQFNTLVKIWNKVSIIEDKLNESIIPTNNEIYYSDLCLIETLYQSFKNKQPIKASFNIDSVELDKTHKVDELDALKNKDLFYNFNKNEEISLLGNKLIVPKILFTTNCRISEIKDNGENYKIIFAHDEKTFTGHIYFASEEERDQYQQDFDIDFVMNNCKDISEFLNEDS